MATADDIITLPRLRHAIGGVGDSDGDLDPYRLSAIRWVERYTGRVLIDRTNQRSYPEDFGFVTRRYGLPVVSSSYSIRTPSSDVDVIWFSVPDIKPWSGDALTLHYSTPDDSSAGRPSTSENITYNDTDRRVVLDHDGLMIYGDPTNPWYEKLRYDNPTPYIVIPAQGVDPSEIPPEFGQAVALIVRALYDGSAYDDLGSKTTLKMLLMPFYPTGGGLRRLR